MTPSIRAASFVALMWLPLLAHADDPGATVATAGNGRGSIPCASCHGADGGGNASAAFPRLAGLPADYIARQVRLVRDGQRTAPAMVGLDALSEEEIDAVADYYATLPVPETSAEAPAPEQARLAEGLVHVGDWPGRDLPPCVSCHGPGARGAGGAFPGLAGQHASYLEAQLTAWKAKTRATDPGDLMGTVARKLTDDEITAVAAWLAAQPAEVSR